MGLLFHTSTSAPAPTATAGNLALTLAAPGGGLELRRGFDPVVERADLELMLAPCRGEAGIYAEAPAKKRDLAWQKAQFCRACWAERCRPGFEGGLEGAVGLAARLPDSQWPLVAPASRTYPNVRRWIQTLGKDQAGVPQWSAWGRLVKGSGGGRESGMNEEFARELIALYLHPNAPQIKPTWRKVCANLRAQGLGDKVVSYDTAQHYIERHVGRALEAKYREGRLMWANERVGYLKRWCNVGVGDAVYSDHRIMDFWCKVKNEKDEWVAVRPWITAMMDARSNYLTAAIIYTTEYPNHCRILEVLQMHIRNAGNRVPRICVTDNGKDFLKVGMGTPTKLQTKRGGVVLCDKNQEPYEYSVLRALGIEHQRAGDYNGREKPIERLFRDHSQDWEKTQDGYLANKPSARPDQRDTWQGDVNRLPTVEQAQASFNAWLEREEQEHMREEGKTRAQMWREADLGHLRQLDDRDLFMRMLLPDPTARLVSRTPMGPGIKFAGWTYSHADLARHWDRPLMVKTYWGTPTVRVQAQTRDRGLCWREVPYRIFVFTPDDVLVAVAIADGAVPMFATTDEEREVIGEKKHTIHRIAARTTDAYEELTGSRRIESPQQILRPLVEEERRTQGIVERPALPERATRRLQGDCGAAAGAAQDACIAAADTSDLAAWKRAQAEDEDEDESEHEQAATAGAGRPAAMADYLRHRQIRGQDDE